MNAQTKLLVLSLFVSVAGAADGGRAFRTSDPLKAFVYEGYAWGDDYFIHGNQDTTLFRCVLVKKKDGFDGLALSEVSIWGNHGGPWEIFKKTRTGFEYVGSREVRDTSCLESCRSKEYLATGRCDWHRGWASVPATPTAGAGAPRAVATGTLSADDLSSAPFECDCEFYRGRVDGSTVVFATREHRTLGLAKIDGETVRLRPSRKAGDGGCRKGARFRERWSDGSVSIDLDGVVTTSGAEACWYRARMTVTNGKHGESIPVTGSCGC